MKDKPLRLWGGFVDGKLDTEGIDGKWYDDAKSAAIFRTRQGARRQYEDVRRIGIKVIDRKLGK